MGRDYILTEIRRTAAENGGTPLGRLRFRQETGIREHDWNKFWPRWSEAIAAAGLVPTNTFVVAFPLETMLQRLADLTRELGRFPVTRELKVKAAADARFPSSEAFRRLGSVRSLMHQLRTFAMERGYDDVVALCPTIPDHPERAFEGVRAKAVDMGAVYLLKSGGFFKIGHSNAVGRRERELAIQLPEKSKVIHEIRTDDPSGIEAYWHRRFNDKRKNGEWFALTPEDIATFRRRKMM